MALEDASAPGGDDNNLSSDFKIFKAVNKRVLRLLKLLSKILTAKNR